MANTETATDIDDAAQELLDGVGATEQLSGLEADTKVSVLNTAYSTSREFALGERVELRVVGYVNFKGEQLVENEGKKKIIKIQSNLIEVIES